MLLLEENVDLTQPQQPLLVDLGIRLHLRPILDLGPRLPIVHLTASGQ